MNDLAGPRRDLATARCPTPKPDLATSPLLRRGEVEVGSDDLGEVVDLAENLARSMGGPPAGTTSTGWPYWTTERGNRILGPWPEYDWSGLR